MPIAISNSDWDIDIDKPHSADDSKPQLDNKEGIFIVTWKDVSSLIDLFCLVGFLAGQIFYSVGYLLPIILNE